MADSELVGMLMFGGSLLAGGLASFQAYLEYSIARGFYKTLNPVVREEVGKPSYFDFFVSSLTNCLDPRGYVTDRYIMSRFRGTKRILYESYRQHRR